MPSSLKGFGSREKPVMFSISGSLIACPNRAYLVFNTFGLKLSQDVEDVC